MATKGISVNSLENGIRPSKQFKDGATEKTQRKTLQTLQLSAIGEKNISGKGINRTDNGKNKKKIKPSNERVKVFEDENPPLISAPLITQATQTETDEDHTNNRDGLDDLAEADREALELMSGENVPENYWRLLAEERRNALNDTLEENEQLHKEVDSLRDENEKLSDLASKAEYLSSVLQSVISDEEDNDSVDDEDYKTGDEQLLDDDTNSNTVEVCDSDSDSSVYSAAASNFKTTSTAETNIIDSESSDEESQSNDSATSENSIRKRVKESTQRLKVVCQQSQRFSGEWVNVELDEEKVASTEIIKGDVLAKLKEDKKS
ncbi:geminin-like [Haliotis rubra]|uniref:geminin-like n=1 Tax=Haliotis rubra TaxID=36100 RepID=UPI001EE623B4|nr:geminin-like [Haliotis rubra]